MIAHANEHLESCAGHVLGNLHDTESRRWLEHVGHGCPDCEAAVDRFAEAALVVAHGAPLRPAPAALREKVLSDALLVSATSGERVQPKATGPTIRIGMGISGWITIYVAAALIVLGIYHNVQVGRLKAENAALTQRIAQISNRMVEAARWEAAVGGPGSRVLTLRPLHAGAGSERTTVFFDPKSRRAVIVGSDLAPASGSRLVAWVVGDGAPVALGVLAPDRAGAAVLRVEAPAAVTSIRGFAVSREPPAADLPPAPGEVLLQGRVTD